MPDTVFENARIYTGHEARDGVIAVADDRIVFVGESGGGSWRALVSADANVVDLQGRTIIPGLIDSHTHPGMVSLSSWHISLPRTDDCPRSRCSCASTSVTTPC